MRASFRTPDVNEPIRTAAVLILCSIFFLGHTLGTVLSVYLLLSPFYGLVVIYLAWTYAFDLKTSKQGGRRFDFYRNLKTWNFFRDYFPIKLIRTKRLDPKRNYIFGYHPHGIMCIGAWLNFATEATGFSRLFPGIKPYLMTLTIMFKFPFFRDFVMAGGVCEVSKESVEHVLSQEGSGNAAVIVVGGAAESLDARPGSHRLTLRNRKGFVKLALKHGASLVPVYSFGENELFSQVSNPHGSWLRQMQTKLQRILSFAPPLFFGRGLLPKSIGFLPHKRPVCTVGKYLLTMKRSWALYNQLSPATTSRKRPPPFSDHFFCASGVVAKEKVDHSTHPLTKISKTSEWLSKQELAHGRLPHKKSMDVHHEFSF